MEKRSITHRFVLGGQKCYLTCVLDSNDNLDEIFLKIDKKGTLISGYAETLAGLVNLCLEKKVPLLDILKRLEYHKFEPSGTSSNKTIPFAGSIGDYIAKYLKFKFIKEVLDEKEDY